MFAFQSKYNIQFYLITLSTPLTTPCLLIGVFYHLDVSNSLIVKDLLLFCFLSCTGFCLLCCGSLEEEHDIHLSYFSDPSLHPRTCLVPQECQNRKKAETSPLELTLWMLDICFNLLFLSPEEPGGWGFSQSCHTELGVGVGMGLQQISAMILSTSFDVGTELLTSSESLMKGIGLCFVFESVSLWGRKV